MEELYKTREIYNKCILAGTIALVVGILIGKPPIMYILIGLGAIIVLAGVNYKDKHWVCPKCKKSLGNKTEIPEKCPHCGKKLQTKFE